MIYRLIEVTEDAQSITTTAYSDWYDIGGQGVDCLSFVCVASASSTPVGATLQLQGANDQAYPVSVGSTVAVSGDGNFAVEKDRPVYKWYRIKYAISTGSYTSTLEVLGKGDKAE